MKVKIDRTGHRYGRWTVVSEAPAKIVTCGARFAMWNCICDCGNTGVLMGSALGCGGSKSCGCLSAELSSRRNRTHGKTHTAEYRIWIGIKKRCYDPRSDCYKNYGGRGIRVSRAWFFSFQKFFDYVGPRPSPSHSLGRINNDGNYEQGNVKWETPRDQARNKRNVRNLTINGRTMCITDWADAAGIRASTIHSRIKGGWSIESAVMGKHRETFNIAATKDELREALESCPMLSRTPDSECDQNWIAKTKSLLSI